MARRPTRNKPQPINPPMPPHKLVVVNGKQPGKVPTHLRRVPQKPITPPPPEAA